jgi:two-component system, OmpR family, phosphate regulon response regulator PhoB
MGTVLLAEDDPDIRYMVVFKLDRAGFDVIEAADAPAALDVARRQPLDLALLDVRPPDRTGLMVCRELRAGPRTAHLPIIIVTACARPEDREQAFAAGATDFVAKPFSPRELVHRCRMTVAAVRTP